MIADELVTLMETIFQLFEIKVLTYAEMSAASPLVKKHF
jgi:hypothetical protein